MTLIERIEAATGPDRQLDAEICTMLRVGTAFEWAYSNYPNWLPDKSGRVHLDKNGPSFAAPNFTASIDAALTLVPEKWKLWQMNFSGPCADDRKWHLNLHGGKVGEDTFVGRGKTDTLALCAAALRAREAIHEG